MQKVVQFYTSKSGVQATLPAGFLSASEKCCLASETYALRTVVTVPNIQTNHSNNMHTAKHLQHTNTFTVTTRPDIDHSTQFPVLTAVPQFDCTGTDSLLQRCSSVWCSHQERLHSCAWTEAQNKDGLKKQSETAKAQVKLHSSFNKQTGLSQNCNSERGQLAELLPNSGHITECDWDRYSSADNSGCITECDCDRYSSADNRGCITECDCTATVPLITVVSTYSFKAMVQVVNPPTRARIKTVVNKKPF
jgi:hypothetical protein